LRKYRDALNWGATLRQERFPKGFAMGLDKYLSAYQKKAVVAKKDGNLDTKEADAIGLELYCLINEWALEDGNIALLFWSTTQWNCIARPIEVEALGFRNFKIVGDAISCTNDATKMDKEGVKCFSKHIYGNDEQWFLCQWTCMGLYCMVNADVLGQMDKFFASADNKYGTDAKKYNEQLNALIVSQPRQEMVSLHVRLVPCLEQPLGRGFDPSRGADYYAP